MRIDRRSLLVGSVAAATWTGAAQAQTPPPATPESKWLSLPEPAETIDLWRGLPPGAPASMPVETVKERSQDRAFNDRFISGIARPRMAVFRPVRPNGGAALITPGGGYERVVIDKEGYELARWLAERGVTAFVLFYRLPHEGWASGPDTPLIDAQRAMRIIRHRASAFRIDPARICSIGFFAGGHVCASLLTRFAARVYEPVDAADRLSPRPDAAAPIYPVISMTLPVAHAGSRARLIGERASREHEHAYDPSRNVPLDAPPTFLLHAEDDAAVSVQNTLFLREALNAANVPVETHLFPNGGHGFGLRLAKGHSVEGWQHLFHAWCRRQGLFR